jgi:tetratricopeptide (TPR) repeat protein/tRNA A-37 threonylcarbamoyl transferase component Bud32
MSPDHGKDELDSTRSFKYIAAGSVIAHYRIIEKIGEGAMGQVYLAEDTRLKRRVALKFLPYDLTRDEEAKKRFLQEAQVASSLDHPHICNIHEIEETADGQTFICMSFYEGDTLKRRIETGSLGVEAVLRIAIQVCDGLSRAHEAGIVHRDIKPGNIMVTERGRAKILDFGLAKLAGQTQLTRTGMTVGTALYMSPEQARGEAVDQRSDVWSVGVVLYEALTGTRPFRGANSSAVIYSILHEEPKAVNEINRSLPRELAGIVGRCLKKNPAERYQSAAELEDSLEKVLDELTSDTFIAVPVPAFARAERVRRIALPVGILVIALLLVLLTPLKQRIALWVGGERPQRERRVLLLDFELEGENIGENMYCEGLVDYIAYRLNSLESPEDSLWTVTRYAAIATDLSLPEKSCLELGANVAVRGTLACHADTLTLTLSRYDVHGPGFTEVTDTLIITDHRANLVTWQDSASLGLARMLDARMTRRLRQDLSSGHTIVPGAFESYLTGLGYMKSPRAPGELDSSIVWLEKATRLDPSYALAFSHLGHACRLKFRKTKSPEWAERGTAACRSAIELYSRLVSPRITLGQIQAAAGDTSAAIATLLEAQDVDPIYRYTYWHLADLYKLKGDMQAAELVYRTAAERRPRDAIAQWDLAKFYYRAGSHSQAVEYYKRALELAPQNIWFLSGLAAAYDLDGHHAEAITILERSLEIKPDYLTYTNLGTLYFYDTRFADAAAMYEKALEMNPDAWYTVRGSLAESYYWMPGKRDTALALLEQTAELAEREMAEQPDDAVIVTDLASYYAELGRTEDARRLIEHGVNLSIADPATEFRIAEVYESLGERDLAIQWIARAVATGYAAEYVVNSPRFRGMVADERFRSIPEVLKYLEREREGD